jgi:HlyD family secretion protein
LTAYVWFVTAEKADVLKVPNAALRFRPPGVPAANLDRPGATRSSTGLVWILGPDGQPVAVPVTLGITDGASTEIVQGDLDVGHAVVIGLEAAAPAPSTGPGLRL